ncbi:AbiH family protein [Leeuwenhoekiella sp. MAR_2009_132]|uniref:AbiH family protein n=1 Tax=Leeuwenhoekiella sp. MAR_2009_132 TaxID=1392489 RepID=UPI000690BE49|nr:AbiH family protein [Leeuwenhoekiella sp. MAR_2009_132]
MEYKQELIVNKLVLLGNGFDLALGLRTGYADFMYWLKKKLILEAFQYPGRRASRHYYGYLENDIYTIEIPGTTEQNWGIWLTQYKNTKVSYEEERRDFYKFIRNQASSLTVKPVSNFINQIDKNIENLGWVNIEYIFYQNLKVAKGSDINTLNAQLVQLKGYLKEYLIEEQDKIKSESSSFSPYRSRICQSILQQNEFNPEVDLDNKELKLGKIQFVNFNYTNTVSKLIKQFDARQELITNPIIQIHGGLDESMIFGYGDEEDDDYPRLEKTGENKYLEHVKSFRYLQNSDYYDLIRFINSSPYQIIILGHSCGLSDRTMLKELFESENCLSIKPFYYQWSEEYEEEGEPRTILCDDYFDKVMEISRHFTNNGLMRKKLVSFDKCEVMPQILNRI